VEAMACMVGLEGQPWSKCVAKPNRSSPAWAVMHPMTTPRNVKRLTASSMKTKQRLGRAKELEEEAIKGACIRPIISIIIIIAIIFIIFRVRFYRALVG
jgi:hypothetical protein